MKTGKRKGVASEEDLEEDGVAKPSQAQIDAEFARLTSMRVDPRSISGVKKAPGRVLAAMAKFNDVPLTEGWRTK
jgi:hypothetical protein